jgi:hypothetical protein
MIGSDDPVVGTVNRTCNGTARDGEGSVIGVMEMVGVAVLTEILLAWSMRACSARGGDVDCMAIDFRNVLVKRCCCTSDVKVIRDRGLDERASIELREDEIVFYISSNLFGCGVYVSPPVVYIHIDRPKPDSVKLTSAQDGDKSSD